MSIENIDEMSGTCLRVLSSVYDKETRAGLSKTKALRIKDISEKVSCSEITVRKMIAILLKHGLVDKGIKKGKFLTYHITNKGLEYARSITECVIDESLISK